MERFLSTSTIHSLDNNLLNSLINSCLDIDLGPITVLSLSYFIFSLFKIVSVKDSNEIMGYWNFNYMLYILYIPIV